MKKIHYTLFIVFILFTQTLLAGPGYFSWKGAISTAWSNPANWSPSGVPGSGDTIYYKPDAGTYALTMDSNKTVNLFTILSGTLDISTKTLTITGTALFGGGQISNGRLVVSNSSSVTFSGTTFSSVVNITCNSIYLNGSTFNDSLSITKNGSSNDNSKGHNTYNKYVALTNTYKGSIVLSDSFPDTFNKILAVKNTFESGFIYLAHRATGNAFNDNVIFTGRNIYSNYYGTADYKGNIILNCPNGEVCFGTSTGSCTLANGRGIALGDSAFSAGQLVLKNFTKLGTDGVTSLTLTGSASMNFVSSVFNTDVTVVAPSVNVQSTRFLANCSLTKSGSGTQTSIGGNYFGGIATIVNNHSSGTFTLGSTTVDTFALGATIKNQSGTLQINNAQFNDTVRIINTESSTTNDRLYFANTGTVRFKKSVTIQNSGSGLCFGNANGATQLDSTRTLTFVGSILGNITLQHFNQVGPGSQSINFPNDGAKLILGPNSTFNANFTYYGKNVSLNGVTFNGTTSITKYGNISDTCAGGNVFNGSTVIKDSLAATHKFILAYTTADDYNGNVTFVQKGTGAAMYPSYTKNSTFAANITVDASSAFQFGGNGGKVILDGTGNQILSNLSSGTMTMKKLQLNKTSNSFTLSSALAISDSLMLTKGWINTDTTNLLSLVNGSKLVGGSDSSYINGPVKKTGNAAFVFPTGSSVLAHPFHPIEITAPSSSSDAYTANYFSSGQSIGSAIDTSIDNLNACQYWKLNRNSGTSKLKVKLGWNHDSCETISPTNFRVTGWNGTLWKDLGNLATTGDSVQGTVQSVDSLNTIVNLSLAFKKCSAFRTTITHFNVRCNGGDDGFAVLTAKGGTAQYAYLWSSGLGASAQASNLFAGVYTIQTSDVRGCTHFDSVIISQPEKISLTYDIHESSCNNSEGSITLSSFGGVGQFKYYWPYNGDTTNRLKDPPSGQYDVQVTDSNGCVIFGKANVYDADGPGMNIIYQNNVRCFSGDSGSVEIVGVDDNGPYKYNWFRFDRDTLPTLSELQAGIYPVQITNSIGCVSLDTIIILQPDTFDLSFIITGTACGTSNGEIVALPIGGSNPLSYSWSNSADTDSIISNLNSGVDTLLITDGNGCTIEKIAEVLSTSGFAVSNQVISNVVCFPDSGGAAAIITEGGTAPFQYLWDPSFGENDTIYNLPPNDYYVTVIDSNGCRQKTNFSITASPELEIEFNGFNPTEFSNEDGFIASEVIGGFPPYEYLWNTDMASKTINNLAAGDYSLIVTDSHGCKATSSLKLKSPPPDYNCFNCPTMPSNPLCLSPIATPCLGCTIHLDMVSNFGADPTGISSSQCAFEDASEYIKGLGDFAHCILDIPSGTYMVGRQEQTANWYRLGGSVLCLEGIKNLDIVGLGTGAILKLERCLRYGAFDPSNGDRFLGDYAGVSLTCSTTVGSPDVLATTTGFIFPGYDYTAFDYINGNSLFIVQGSHVTNITSSGFTLDHNANSTGTIILTLFPTCHITPNDYTQMASIGPMIHMNHCEDINISNLELDGNIDDVIIGGTYNTDGIQVGYDGIFMNASKNVTMTDLNVHHFGHDGLYIIYDYCPNPIPNPVPQNVMNCRIISCSFTYNGRNAFSWGGGTGLYAYNSEFSFSGQSRIWSQPGAGMDIEYENSNYPNRNGRFEICSFRYNKYHGYISDNHNSKSRNQTFENCTFVGSEGGDAVWPNSLQIKFINNCRFYGKVWNPFSNRIISWNDLHSSNDLIFDHAHFFEEYTDPDPNARVECRGIHYFSLNSGGITPDETNFVGSAWQIDLSCPVLHHSPLLEFTHSSRVNLIDCEINGNLATSLIWMGQVSGRLALWNRNFINNTVFTSSGMNYCACDPDIAAIFNTNIGSRNSFTRFGNWRPNTCGINGWFRSVFADRFTCGLGPHSPVWGRYWTLLVTPNDPILDLTLCGKFHDIVDPHLAMPLISAPCSFISSLYPSCASIIERKINFENPQTASNKFAVFPTVADKQVNIESEKEKKFKVINALGNVIFENLIVNSVSILDISFIKPGIYFVISDDGQSEKFIKQ